MKNADHGYEAGCLVHVGIPTRLAARRVTPHGKADTCTASRPIAHPCPFVFIRGLKNEAFGTRNRSSRTVLTTEFTDFSDGEKERRRP